MVGFLVLSSDCQKWRLFSILDLRNFESRWTRNLDLVTGPTFVDLSTVSSGLYITHNIKEFQVVFYFLINFNVFKKNSNSSIVEMKKT